MESIYLFLLCLIPVAWSCFSWVCFKSFNLCECLITIGVAIAIPFVIIPLSKLTASNDFETWSGYANNAEYEPRWQSHYVETRSVYTTDSEGNSAFSHYEYIDHYDWHGPNWWVNTTLGNISIDENSYHKIEKDNRPRKAIRGSRINYHKGDLNNYVVNIIDTPEARYLPVNVEKFWKNNLKHAQNSLYGYEELDVEIVKENQLPEYPRNKNPFFSNRIIGKTSITIKEWDQLNTVLGPIKKANLILVNFGNSGSHKGELLKQYWKGGKKNDLVLCYGEEAGARWSYVFGWTESELCKANLASILLTNNIDSSILPLIRTEVLKNYELRDWKSLNKEIKVEAPIWGVILAIVFQVAAQIGLHKFFHENEF